MNDFKYKQVGYFGGKMRRFSEFFFWLIRLKFIPEKGEIKGGKLESLI